MAESLGHVGCLISQIFYENADHRWKALSRKLFALMPTRNKSSIVVRLENQKKYIRLQYRGGEAEAVQLTGAVVQLKLSCPELAEASVCLSFRVDGTSGQRPPESIRWEVCPTLSSFCTLISVGVGLCLLSADHSPPDHLLPRLLLLAPREKATDQPDSNADPL